MKYRISFTVDSSTDNIKKIREAVKGLNIDVEDGIVTFPNYIKIKELKFGKGRRCVCNPLCKRRKRVLIIK